MLETSPTQFSCREKELSHITIASEVQLRDDEKQQKQRAEAEQRRVLSFDPDEDEEADEIACEESRRPPPRLTLTCANDPSAATTADLDCHLDQKPDVKLEEKKQIELIDPDHPVLIELDASDDECMEVKPSTSTLSEQKPARERQSKKPGKDPTVDTSFLPDKIRDAEENRLVGGKFNLCGA